MACKCIIELNRKRIKPIFIYLIAVSYNTRINLHFTISLCLQTTMPSPEPSIPPSILSDLTNSNPSPSIANSLKVKLYCLLIVGSFYYVPAALIAIRKRVKDRRRRLCLFLALLTAYLLPLSQWPMLRDMSLWEDLRKYFQVRIVNAENLPSLSKGTTTTMPSENAPGSIFAVFPHGIVPFPLGLLQFGHLNKLFSSLRITMASVVQYIPIFGQLLLLGGGIDASYPVLAKAISNVRILNISHIYYLELY